MEKLYYIYLIIRNSKTPIPAMDIRDTLEDEYDIRIEIKTVYQAIKNINKLYELYCGKQLIRTIRRNGYIIDEEFFEDGQIQYLWDSVVSNKNLNSADANKMLKALSLLSSENQLERLNVSKLNHDDNTNNMFLAMTNVIKAIHNKKTIYFKYVSYEIQNGKFVEVPHKNGNLKDDPEFYIISPYRLILKDSKYYVQGYYAKRRNALSTYRLDRMRIVRIHKSPYHDITDQFDFEKEASRINMYTSGEVNTLKIEFDNTVIREVVNQFGQDNHVEEVFDNKYRMTIEDVLISDGLIGWLMMLQEHIRVISPIDLREEMKNRIAKMMESYK